MHACAVYPRPGLRPSKISAKFTGPGLMTDQVNARYRPDPVHPCGLHHRGSARSSARSSRGGPPPLQRIVRHVPAGEGGLRPMATVQFDKATRIYPGTEKPAVDGLEIEVGDGEFLVLVGPSGCGKSTSLRMLAGLEDVNGGAIRIGDRDVTHLPPKDRDIAMVFQNYALYPHMTVADNMGFALKIAGVNKA